jgi:hypothetical protein
MDIVENQKQFLNCCGMPSVHVLIKKLLQLHFHSNVVNKKYTCSILTLLAY